MARAHTRSLGIRGWPAGKQTGEGGSSQVVSTSSPRDNEGLTIAANKSSPADNRISISDRVYLPKRRAASSYRLCFGSIFYEGGGLVSKDVTFDGASVRNVTLSRTTPRGMKVCTRCLSPSLSFCLLARLCTSHLFSLRTGSLIIVAWNSDDSEDRALFWKLNSS